MKYHLTTMDSWYHKMPGAMLLEIEREHLKGLLSHCFGEYLVQIGGPSDLSLTKASPINHRIYVIDQYDSLSSQSSIISKPSELPFLPNSIDVVVMAQMLEYVDDPKIVLRETYDMLAPNGIFILFGFNYWGLWSLCRLKQRHGFPWGGKFHAVWQVKRWLQDLGFKVISDKTLCFRPPSTNPRRSKHLLFLEAVGQICLPALGGVYMIAAQKTVVAVTPIKEKWWLKILPEKSGYVKPTTRNGYNDC